jgi:dihydroorotate dehydrogenase (fumarate)
MNDQSAQLRDLFSADCPFLNAAGTVKLVEQVERLARAPVAGVVVGSYTIEPRTGNEGRVYESVTPWTLNALGLPNPGAAYMKEHLPRMRDALGDRPLIASVAGFGLNEYVALATDAIRAGAWVEVNFGCPNVAGHSIASFDVGYMRRTWDAIMAACAGGTVGVKLSPYSDPGMIPAVVSGLESAGVPDFYTLSNTFPNAWREGWLDTSYGGLSGEAMKPIVLGQIKQFREVTDVPIIGSGGVRYGHDWHEYQAAGACAVQVGSRYLNVNEDPRLFSDLLADLTEAAA